MKETGIRKGKITKDIDELGGQNKKKVKIKE